MYSLVLWFLHVAYGLLVWLRTFSKEVRVWLKPPRLVDFTESDKLPAHVAFVLESRAASIDTVVCIVSHCATLGIHEVTMYDAEGAAKADHATLSAELDTDTRLGDVRCHVALGTRRREALGTRGGEAPTAPAARRHTTVRVNLLSLEDGRANVAEAALDSPVYGEPADIFAAQHRLRQRMFASHGACQSEPQLLIKLGPTPALDGFPPWLLRVAELGHVEGGRLTMQRFQVALWRYARTEQRFGK